LPFRSLRTFPLSSEFLIRRCPFSHFLPPSLSKLPLILPFPFCYNGSIPAFGSRRHLPGNLLPHFFERLLVNDPNFFCFFSPPMSLFRHDVTHRLLFWELLSFPPHFLPSPSVSFQRYGKHFPSITDHHRLSYLSTPQCKNSGERHLRPPETTSAITSR